MRSTQRAAFAGVLSLITAAPLAAQQQVPFRNNIPVAPQGLSVPSLPPAPVRYETAEGQNIEVTVVVRGLRAALESRVRGRRHDARHGAGGQVCA